MCIYCENSLNVSEGEDINNFDCSFCTTITEIPINLALRANLITLNCSYCIGLTKIPNIFTKLKELDCRNCNIVSIPDTFINLITLNCSFCIGLINLPNTFISPKGTRSNLKELRCIFCTNLIKIPEELNNLVTIDCSYCEGLTKIGNFAKLQDLRCDYCYNIVELSSKMKNITYLNCIGCYGLTEVSDIFKNCYLNFIYLDFTDCRNLIKIPNKFYTYPDSFLHNLSNILYSPFITGYRLGISGCGWLNHPHNGRYFFNIQKLKVLQRWFRKNIRYWIFKRWIKSEEGVKWLYDPCRLGGRIVKNNILIMLNKS